MTSHRFLFLMAAFLVAGPVFAEESAPDSREKLLGELETLNGEARDLEKRLSELRAAWRKTRLTLERDLGRATRDVEARKAEDASLCEKLDGVKKEIAQVEGEKERINDFAKGLARATSSYFDQLDRLVRDGIPWKRARRRRAIKEARFFAEQDRPDPVTLLSAAERLQKQEEALGRMVESGTVRLDLSGTPREVQAFHIGRIGVVFADPEGDVAGFARAGESLADACKAFQGHAKARDTYGRALDVLFKRRAPHVADLYLPGFDGKGER